MSCQEQNEDVFIAMVAGIIERIEEDLQAVKERARHVIDSMGPVIELYEQIKRRRLDEQNEDDLDELRSLRFRARLAVAGSEAADASLKDGAL